MSSPASLSRRLAVALLASTALSAGIAHAQEVPDPTAQPADPALPSPPAEAPRAPAADEDEIVVTATKRAENLQDVPIAITAITTKTLDDLQVNSFEDYARLVPSLSYKSGGGGGSADGPGTNNVYFRGVASGENANHSASLPSVGTYLDEQPITTITGALDVHVFDMARIEALAGPQGTLYGASSQAGTVRLITNKPDLSSTYGAVNLEVNHIAHGEMGFGGEGFVNLPISSNVAARIVGWYRRDGGYIDNIEGSLPFPVFTTEPAPTPEDPDAFIIVPTGEVLTFENDELAEEDYNDVYTYGARAALRIELNDRWTVTPQLMGQHMKSYGSFAEESGLGELETMQFNPEKYVDKWYQAALTVEGKIANFDVTYAGAYMQRQVDSELDYVDYGYFYNALFNYVGYLWYDDAGDPIIGNQFIIADDSFTKQSHELRFASPAENRLRLIAGLFYQRQTHNIEQNYIIPGITSDFVVTGTESNIWLTKQLRTDRDYAAFGELSYDITPQFTVTAGGRLYHFDNSLVGFFGFNANYSGSTGESQCFGPPEVDGSPCTNLDKSTKDTGFVHRLNATWKPNEDLLLYATWSRGFRPGGVNRRGTLPPYGPDFLTNYEAGAKISFGAGAHFNIAAYREDWDDMQLSFLGENGLTEIRNAGNARIWGFEADLLLRPAEGLTWSTGVAYNNAKIRNDFCKFANEQFDCTIPFDLNGNGVIDEDEEDNNELLAESGTRLPLTAKWKANSHIRYTWPIADDMDAHVQGSVTYEGNRRRDLRDFENMLYGNLKSYFLVDASTGVDRGPWNLELYVKNLFDKRAQLSRSIQCLEVTCGDPDGETAIGGKTYTVVSRPRTIGLRVGYRF